MAESDDELRSHALLQLAPRDMPSVNVGMAYSAGGEYARFGAVASAGRRVPLAMRF